MSPSSHGLGPPLPASRFRARLLRWYDAEKRDLPWRATRDPYRVWVSEVMLQQTRVAAVLAYYEQFLRRFPSVQDLSRARSGSVLAAWSGLGYYRRARMMHAAARQIVRVHRGEFPRTAEAWRGLPGIGRYTAAAIASIAFGEPIAVVDGNVERVLQRVTGRPLAGEALWQQAQQALSRRRPADFNQAMMELGATVCLPRQPLCSKCPVRAFCATRGALPAGLPRQKRLRREHHCVLDLKHGAVYLVRRPARAALMPGMWELPGLSAGNGPARDALVFRHSITVTDYTVYVSRSAAPRLAGGAWVQLSRLPALPLTGLARKILRAANVIQ